MTDPPNEADEKPVVQLGFSIPSSHDDDNSDDDDEGEGGGASALGHRSSDWSKWDGGKIGGRPSWLNPRDLPFETPLRCRARNGSVGGGGSDGTTTGGVCGAAMRFVAQLYSPADDDADNAAAFHRSVYVFACPSCCSSGSLSSPGAAPSECFSNAARVLRCQLPKANDFYPPRGGGGVWEKHTPEYWSGRPSDEKLNLCAVCGQRGGGKCPKQGQWFCGPDHQKECLRASKRRKDGDSSSEETLPSVFRESELVVEEEPLAGDGGADTTSDASSGGMFGNDATGSKRGDVDDEPDLDADMEQVDLNAMTGGDAAAATGVTDPATLAFYERVAIGGKDNDVRDQCLRYSRWEERRGGGSGDGDNDDGDDEEGGGPLWVRSEFRPPAKSKGGSASKEGGSVPSLSETTTFPPPCQYCGAPREFEFQIMPQMLHYLPHGNHGGADGEGEGASPKSDGALTEVQKAVLLEAKSKIDSGAELPEGFREHHRVAVKKARDALLGNNAGNMRGGGGRSAKTGLDWGTIAVYTCTASCGDGGIVEGQPNLGAYREEAAWVQPPLD